MAEAQIESLSRLTSGEIGKDQAILDYFYYDPQLNFQDFMTPGFLDKFSAKFQVGSRISVYCKGNNGGVPPTSTLKRLEAVVAAITPFTPQRTYEQVRLLPGPGTWQTNSLLDNTWSSYSCIFQGFVNWTTPALPNPTPGFNTVAVPNSLMPLGPDDKILFNQPAPGDPSQGHMVRTCQTLNFTQVEVNWQPVTGGSPLAVYPDPQANLDCQMFIQIWSNILN